MATKSKGIGRGKGGGRPRKHPCPVSPIIDEAARKEADRLGKVVVAGGALAPAPAMVGDAYRTLKDVLDHSTFAAPRVTAARAIIDLARAAETEAKNSIGGKKQEQRQLAENRIASGGKFAPPDPPRGFRAN